MAGFGSKKVARRAGRISGEVRRERQLKHAAKVIVHIEAYRKNGHGWRVIAGMLNLSGYSAPRGGSWHPLTVRRVYEAGLRHGVQLPLQGIQEMV